MSKKRPKTTLDEIDYGIIAALQNNARLSNKELAAGVGLSPSACLERVRRLRQSDIIRGYVAEVDPSALGIGLIAMLFVRLTSHERDKFARVVSHLMAQVEVTAVYELAGNDDLLVHVVCRDANHLRDFVADIMGARNEFAHFVTSLVFEHYQKRGLPNLREQS